MSEAAYNPNANLERDLRWVGTKEQFGWLAGILKVVVVLNLIDAVLTLFWVHAGRATEANPLLADLVVDQPLLFLLVKMGLVIPAAFVLWRNHQRPTAVVGIFGVFIVYYWLLLYHLQSMDLGLLRRFMD